MLPARNRLTKKKDFENIKESGNSFFSALFRIRILPNKLKSSRFAIVISNKVSKKATVRNRLKRQLREILRLNLAKFKCGFDIVLIVNNKALAKSYQELEVEVLRVLTKAKIVK